MVPPDLDELNRLACAFRQTTSAAETARKARDRAIRQAIAAGATQAEIAAATGLRQQRIGQIARGLAVRGPGRPPKEKHDGT